jgi:glutathione S-transferase
MATCLYYSPGSCSLASHIVLEEIGKPYDVVEVNVKRGDHLKPEYLAINPHARVPTLKVGAFILTECPAILAYLDRTNPDAALLPEDPAQEARGLSLMSWLASTVHVSFAHVFRPERWSGDDSALAGIKTRGIEQVRAHFDEIEGLLVDGQYSLGRRFSVLDPYLLVFYRWGHRIALTMDSYPRFTAHAQRIAARPAAQRVFAQEGITLTG